MKREHYVNKLIVALSLLLSGTLIGTVNDQQYFSVALTHSQVESRGFCNSAVNGAIGQLALMWTMIPTQVNRLQIMFCSLSTVNKKKK